MEKLSECVYCENGKLTSMLWKAEAQQKYKSIDLYVCRASASTVISFISITSYRCLKTEKLEGIMGLDYTQK